MNIGIIRLYSGSSGATGFYNSQEIGLAKAMKKKGHKVTVIYVKKNIKSPEEAVESDIDIVYVPAKSIGVHSYFKWSILLKYKFDILQVNCDNQLFAPDLIRFCTRNNIRVYNYIGAVGSDSSNALKRILMSILFRRNIRMYKRHKCFAKTPAVMHELRKYGIKDVQVAPVGLDLSVIPVIDNSRCEIRERLQLPQDKTVLLYVGRIDEYKRPLETIRVLENLPEDYRMVIIGTGNLDDKLEALIRQKGLGERIIRIKKIPNKKIHEYYIASDYYLNFNIVEIFGMSILEAMYHRCTVIANHAPGPDYIIEDNKSGYLVSDTEQMISLIKDNRKIDRKEAMLRVLDNFEWNKTAEIIENWIREK